MVLVTHMPYPYFLSSGPTLVGPSDLTWSVDSDPLESSNCSDSAQQCVQFWKINIAPLSEDDHKCDFSGVFNLTFAPTCFRSSLSYKYTCAPLPYHVSASLQTSKYCPFLTPLAIGLTGTLTTHSDAALTTAASSFDLENTVYFKLVVEGDAEVDSVIIEQATLTLGNSNSALTMVADGLAVSTNPLNEAQVTVSNSAQLSIRNTASISFVLKYEYAPIASKSSTLATLSVVAGVTFANTDGTTTRRLMTFERTISPESLKLNRAGHSESHKWKRNFAKLANKRKGASDVSAVLPDDAALDLKLLQSAEPVLRTRSNFIIGPAHFI
jgi:hypothetical protein